MCLPFQTYYLNSRIGKDRAKSQQGLSLFGEKEKEKGVCVQDCANLSSTCAPTQVDIPGKWKNSVRCKVA
jgi:hypothetical protein